MLILLKIITNYQLKISVVCVLACGDVSKQTNKQKFKVWLHQGS